MKNINLSLVNIISLLSAVFITLGICLLPIHISYKLILLGGLGILIALAVDR